MGGRLAHIFVGGSPPDIRVLAHLHPTALVIAADSGWSNAVSLGCQPSLLVGDMDSIDPADLEAARQSGCETMVHPADKDLTDAEIALDEAIARGCNVITLVSGGGDRFDHILAMVHSFASTDADVTAFIGPARLTYCRPARPRSLQVERNSLVSLIPIGGDATGVHTTGLKWNLDGDTLRALRSRGVSNVTTADHLTISIRDGRVAIVQPDFLEA